MKRRTSSKYDALWEYVRKEDTQSFLFTFSEIEDIAGIPIDHSFLKYKKELETYGYQVGKISMKEGLEGYSDYARKTKYTLLPFIW